MSMYLSRLSDPDAAYRQYSYIRSLDMREMIIANYEPPHELLLPLVESSKKYWQHDGDKQSIGLIKGYSIVKNNSYQGEIADGDAYGFRWIEKKFSRTGLNLEMKNHANIGLMIGKRRVKITPVTADVQVQFDIQIKAKASIIKMDKTIPDSVLNSEAEKLIKREVQTTYQKGIELGADVYQLSSVLYKKNLPVWKKVQKGGKIPLTMNSIRKLDVTVMVEDGGKQRKVPALT
jgi:spore germination protein KC